MNDLHQVSPIAQNPRYLPSRTNAANASAAPAVSALDQNAGQEAEPGSLKVSLALPTTPLEQKTNEIR